MMFAVSQGDVNVGTEALRLLGAELEEAWVLRTPTGRDHVILQDGRSFPLPEPDAIPEHPEIAARISAVAAAERGPWPDDEPQPAIGRFPALPPGYSDTFTLGPWEPYEVDGGWSAHHDADAFDGEINAHTECVRRCNFLNMLASGEPIKAV